MIEIKTYEKSWEKYIINSGFCTITFWYWPYELKNMEVENKTMADAKWRPILPLKKYGGRKYFFATLVGWLLYGI